VVLMPSGPHSAIFWASPIPDSSALAGLGGDLLDQAHPIRLLRSPVLAGKHVAHGVSHPASRENRMLEPPPGNRPTARLLQEAEIHIIFVTELPQNLKRQDSETDAQDDSLVLTPVRSSRSADSVTQAYVDAASAG
jgi:hypothetical protein